MPTTDPSWLFSTAAQSAAAIVAIVGGFLATRIVSLSAERDSIRHRIQTIDAALAGKRQRLEDARSRRLAWDAEEFLEAHLADLVEAPDPAPLEDLVRQDEAIGEWGEEDLRPFYDQAVATIREARELLEAPLNASDPPPGDFDTYMRQTDLDVSGLTRTIYEAVYDHLWDLRNKRIERQATPLGKMFGVTMPDFRPLDFQVPPVATPAATTAYRDLYKREEGLAGDVAQLVAEKQVYEERYRELGTADPLVVWVGFGVLAYFAAVGVAFPLWMLPQSTGPISPSLRWTTLGLFLSGLMAVVVYFALAIRRVRGAREPGPNGY